MAADLSSVSTQELYSLLVPLTGTRLIVPRVCVAEVTGVGQLRLLEEDPAWLVGTVGWKGEEIPLISFEAACGEPMPELGNRSRAVIFHASEGRRPGYFAVMSQGLPQLVRINPGVVSADDDRSWPENSPILCRIRMINEYPLVPDIDRIEGMLEDSAERWR